VPFLYLIWQINAGIAPSKTNFWKNLETGRISGETRTIDLAVAELGPMGTAGNHPSGGWHYRIHFLVHSIAQSDDH
jgi:hypothetical protein